MCVSFTDIDDIVRNVSLYNEYGILVATYIKTFTLTDSIKLSAIMLSDYLSIRILLITCLLYMLSSASVCFRLKPYIVSDRLRKPH